VEGRAATTAATAIAIASSQHHHRHRQLQKKDKKAYLYASMEDGAAYPVREYMGGHTDNDNDNNDNDNNNNNKKKDADEEKPDFLYNPNYAHHRVVEFYSPMCPHCIHFAPRYVEFAQHFTKLTQWNNHNHNSNNTTSSSSSSSSLYTGIIVEFHAVSCFQHRTICQKQKIRSYPTLTLFRQKSINGTIIRQNDLHPMTLIKQLGVSVIDDNDNDDDHHDHHDRGEQQQQQQGQQENGTEGMIFLPRSSQEIFSDAYLSFHTAMKTSLFLEKDRDATTTKSSSTTTTTTTTTIPIERQYVLQNFLDLLQKVLPPWKIHDLLSDLLGHQKASVKNTGFVANIATEETWNAVLDRHVPHRTEWSMACQQHESPYACGLWTLFHIVTIGVVEYNSQTMAAAAADSTSANRNNYNNHQYELFNNQVAAKIIKDYIQEFFVCETCVTKFVQEYDDCMYDRCTRLNEKSMGSIHDWKELSLWLLEVHNGINLRLQKERFAKQQQQHAATTNSAIAATPTIEQQQAAMWPPVQDCPNCWMQHNGTDSLQMYNHEMMHKYLRLVYWYVTLFVCF